jgi:5-methyltetrahydropteroyltriglutamate--homocysteine methyltransferase
MKPPFRADHVGSLLRPPELSKARAEARCGALAREALLEFENRAIRDAVARQEAIGLEAVSDGEFRRDWWHLDFLSRLEGVTLKPMSGPVFGGTGEQPPIASVTARVRYASPIMVEDFCFLRDATQKTAKLCIPSPSMLHMRAGRAGISREAYPTLEAFWEDAVEAYRKAIAAFAAAGCTYLQLDDTAFAFLCDPKMREACRSNGDDPDALPGIYASTINRVLRDRPAGMTVTLHTCRGNFKSAWVAEGGYESVARALFSAEVDGYFMEFDSARAGGFEPLRFAPKAGRVVLGLVTTKFGELETKDQIKRRIDEAARYVPIENLCVSPQCGFSSTHHGNQLSHEDQWRKLERVVEVAREVWG